MIDAVEAFRDIELECVLWPKPDSVEEGSDGLVAGASRAKALGRWRQLGFPFGFQGLAHKGLPCPFMLSWNPEGALFSTPTLGYPNAAQRCGLTIETQCLSQAPPSSWREGFHAVDTRGMFATVILADSTHRQQPSIPGLHQQFLQFTCCPDIFTLRRLVNPLLEAEDMPLHFLPWDVLPGHLQGLALCFGALPLTHGFTFQDTGPTSAYPGHYPWPLLLRASSSPVACGWYLLCEGTGLTKSHWRLLRSQFPWLASVGRCSPPGFSAVQTGQYRRLPAPYPVPFWLQRVSLLRWFAFTMAQCTFACAAHRCLLDGIPGMRLPGSAVYPRFRPLRTSRRPGGYAVTPAPGGRDLQLHESRVTRFIITLRSTRKRALPFDQRVALHPADKSHRLIHRVLMEQKVLDERA